MRGRAMRKPRGRGREEEVGRKGEKRKRKRINK